MSAGGRARTCSRLLVRCRPLRNSAPSSSGSWPNSPAPTTRLPPGSPNNLAAHLGADLSRRAILRKTRTGGNRSRPAPPPSVPNQKLASYLRVGRRLAAVSSSPLTRLAACSLALRCIHPATNRAPNFWTQHIACRGAATDPVGQQRQHHGSMACVRQRIPGHVDADSAVAARIAAVCDSDSRERDARCPRRSRYNRGSWWLCANSCRQDDGDSRILLRDPGFPVHQLTNIVELVCVGVQRARSEQLRCLSAGPVDQGRHGTARTPQVTLLACAPIGLS